MGKPVIKVGVNGYGVIGKRVAEAIEKQSDMKLIGVSDISADWRIKLALRKFPVFCSDKSAEKHMKSHGIDIAGYLEDLIKDQSS